MNPVLGLALLVGFLVMFAVGLGSFFDIIYDYELYRSHHADAPIATMNILYSMHQLGLVNFRNRLTDGIAWEGSNPDLSDIDVIVCDHVVNLGFWSYSYATRLYKRERNHKNKIKEIAINYDFLQHCHSEVRRKAEEAERELDYAAKSYQKGRRKIIYDR